MNGRTLAALYRLNLATIDIELEGITHEESTRRPPNGGNSVNWVLGHIAATRDKMLTLLNETPVWDSDVARPYTRGVDPDKHYEAILELDRLRGDLKTSQERLLPAVERMAGEEGARPTRKGTTLENVLFFHFHEAYHVGQLGILRRFSGKPGAIP